MRNDKIVKSTIILAAVFVLLFIPTSIAYGSWHWSSTVKICGDKICGTEQSNTQIPDWVQNIFIWYDQDQITEDELHSAIAYLVNERILEISSQEIEKLTNISSQDCTGTARCISGTVTKVIDGDTIKVDGQSIRFALASAPELGSYGSGVKETEFIQNICPVGSAALVDEDDNQTQGSYGRIIGMIYCNGLNLNSELLDSGLGYMDFKFCDISEFGNSDWAIKHGCDSKVDVSVGEPQTDNCDSSYPDFCIPSPPPDLDCGDIPQKNFTVLQPDPYRFDGDKDGIGCES